MSAASDWLPVGRPLLPPAAAVRPYLEEVERNRWYANHGPLVRRLEERLAAHYGMPAGSVATLSSGTAGLTAGLLAQGARAGGLCVMPSWSFVASAHAAAGAGLVPYFADVDARSWALTPEAVQRAIEAAPAAVAAVMPVMPFGAPLDMAAWDGFAERSGLAVVVDGAAGFDGLRPGRVPAVVSLHATKVLGVGEGGFLVSRDTALVRAVEDVANFGFVQRREAERAGLNAKMSELHAAVGLAALDLWPRTRAAVRAVAGAYARALDGISGVMGAGDDWVSSTVIAAFDAPVADVVAGRLRQRGIDSRAWWSKGIHRQAAFRGHLRGPLPVTERLAESTLGLPFHTDLPAGAVARVAAALADVLRELRP
ncbi:MAG TPA: DegT/DnrJ/EryC1/StrS family aminotransferase [Azospirillum sp.]|nr:DegT/DnrJ/EryC1/StrS family aminotransferase [Azospirillum sp.]